MIIHATARRLLLIIGGFIVTASVAVFLLFQATPATQVTALTTTPTTMNFQGRLKDGSGTVVADGLYNMRFHIYDSASGGTSLWSETRETTNRVQVTDGLFTVQLGSVTPLTPATFSNPNLYFQITMATPATATCATSSCASFTSVLGPRQKLATSAYAYNAETVDGYSSEDLIKLGPSGTNTNGDLYLEGLDTLDADADYIYLDAGFEQYISADNFLELYAANVRLGNQVSIDGTNSTTKLAVKNSTNQDVLRVDTTNNNVVLGANTGLSVTGGNTASRPASPSEGMVYFDTATKQLLTYANGKWQADRGSDVRTVAASNSVAKDAADYVVSATDETAGNAGVTINAAIDSLPAGGGKVFLLEGTYTVDSTISLPNNTSLSGVGDGTMLRIRDGVGGNINVIGNDDSVTGASIAVRDLQIDGNRDNQSSGTHRGIRFSGVGDASSTGERTGVTVEGVTVFDTRSDGIYVTGASNGRFKDNKVRSSVGHGIYLQNASNSNTLSGNVIKSMGTSGFKINGSSNNVISGNVVQDNFGRGIELSDDANDNIVNNNRFINNNNTGANNAIYLITSSRNSITNNTITDESATANNYAIFITDAPSTENYLADNTLGGGSVQDVGTDTVYANQLDENKILLNSSEGGMQIRGHSSSNVLSVKNDSGSDLLSVDNDSGSISVGEAGDRGIMSADGNFYLDTDALSGEMYLNWRDGSGVRVGNGTNMGYGTVYASAFTISSSQRYKTNIRDTGYGLSQLMSLRAVEYDYTIQDDLGNQLGFIAEEVDGILPEAVTYDDQGRADGIDYGKFTPLVVRSIQQQQTQIAVINDYIANGFPTITVKDTLTTRNLVVEGHIKGNADTRGEAVVLEGEDKIEFEFENAYETTPYVVASPKNEAVLYRVEADEDSFTIHLVEEAAKDIRFNYQVQE